MFLKKLLGTICFMCLFLPNYAQSANFNGLLGSDVAIYGFWEGANNEASFAKISHPTIGISYRNGFLIKETATQYLCFVYPTKTGNFSGSFSRYGYNMYSENFLGLGYSRMINEYFSASVKFNYIYLQQSEAYENKSLFNVELGMIAEPIENLSIGVHLYNPFRAKISDYQNERVQTTMQLGLGYYFTKNIVVLLETEKTLDKKLRIKGGVSYAPVKNFFIRMGVASNPNQFTAGIGYRIKGFGFDVGFATHPFLPVSSQASLKYEF